MRSERLLIFLKPRFLGDAVMATPLLRALAGAFGDTTVFAPPHIEELLREDSEDLKFLEPLPSRGFDSSFRQAGALREMRFDTVVLVNRSVRSAIVAWLAGIRNRIGHDTEGRGLLLTKRVHFDLTKFEAECYGDLGRALGVNADYSRVRLSVSPVEKENGLAKAEGATVGIQPGASFGAKRIPASALAVVAERLIDAGRKVVLIGGKEERPFGEALQKGVDRPLVNLIGCCTLRESMGVVSTLDVCIGASTGIMHIAAALGTPTVTVFGPTDPRRWGHLYSPHQTVKVPSGNIEDVDPEEIYKGAVEVLGSR